MVEERLELVELRENFYRDSFGKMILLIVGFCVAICLLAGISFYLYLDKPKPIVFPVLDEWRVMAPVPVDQPYVSAPELLQWTSDVLRTVFVFDFINYNEQLKAYTHYFTSDGWNIFLNQLSNYVSQDTLTNEKQFVNGTPAGAPYIVSQGLLSGRYAWWLQMPLTISYVGSKNSYNQSLTFQVLVVRVPTLNNLSGLAIDNMMVVKGNPS